MTACAGARSVLQFLAIPVAMKASPLHGGGVFDIDRAYDGFDPGSTWRLSEAGRVPGLAQECPRDDRRGRENFVTSAGVRQLGVSGALRRDEVNRTRTRDVYAQLKWLVDGALTATLGERSGRVEITVDDRLAPSTPTNPGDSGRLEFDYTNPVVGLLWARSAT